MAVGGGSVPVVLSGVATAARNAGSHTRFAKFILKYFLYFTAMNSTGFSFSFNYQCSLPSEEFSCFIEKLTNK